MATLRSWLAKSGHRLVFPSLCNGGAVVGHLLRLCQRVARRAGLDQDGWHLHKFRSSYATFCLKRGLDLETLRSQLGHRDTESLRRYIMALRDEERARKVAEVLAAPEAGGGLAYPAPGGGASRGYTPDTPPPP